jgi:hypothetical protein
MLRTLARFLGIWLLAAALVVAVIDGAKSLAASEVVVTDMAGALAMVDQVLPGPQAATDTPPAPAEEQGFGILAFLLVAPAAPLLALAGVLLLIVGRRRPRHPLGREFMA